MLYCANFGCLAIKVIISAHDKTNEIAAKCLFVWHGVSKAESGIHKIIPTENDDAYSFFLTFKSNIVLKQFY
jgi:hypothetical protein